MTTMQSGRSGWPMVAMIAAVLAGAVVIGVGPRLEQRDARARTLAQATGPTRVRVAAVRAGDEAHELTLPASSTPIRQSTLYSKSTGFVRRYLVELGDAVKAGQVLAEIEAPETDEEIRLARARLAEARANVGIHQLTSDRTRTLAGDGAVSRQEADDALALANSADALVATRKADLKRLQALRGYQQIVAPFDGVVTRRLVDAGALVGPAAAGGVGMFEIADVSKLRVLVDVPDSHAADVKVGNAAELYSPRDPTRTVKGVVTRTSGVLETRTRTLRVEIEVPGDEGVLPGSFVYARLQVPRARPVPTIPASALVVRKEGTLVAKVREGTVTLVPVKLGRDLGKEIEVLEGVAAGDEVVLQPPDTLESGQAVEVVPTVG
ncbi:RND family efflux transporter, MFP subunit [Nannocystis exedens]|uniref:RND family efflux transporter, MFP subunit n=1 Tax=Nannocystis exedens TaxID=54 RepID=A0A1I2CJB0_9BACT|nr:efflux RND transporter periplasmic adaptor subunit [Nannocystis exedens]PCC68280.1 Multidrug resistance protein MdtA precursor [Nannocystis exedens]SFE67903.1 RND family efflux transporter, MFP subunit [Nannocystis exedens]